MSEHKPRSADVEVTEAYDGSGSTYDFFAQVFRRWPSHMRDYVETTGDNGGVHISSGILNHGFYLAAKAIGGKTWEVLGRIYYPSTTFDFPRCFQVATIVCHSNCRADKADLCLPDWVHEKIQAAGIRLQT
jgi:Zn-dependent metalloprotease